ncbi:Uma2 family endonuclease [Bacillus sp. B-jedd]|uniref:Uma2 family endonuclease n=1 Tax=Bacillus sp. B-jedd TaxID=1476857 RepID=UPI0005155DB4|nr:hypothetical protein BN1002_03993 [Bacillus sp. B-jedd]
MLEGSECEVFAAPTDIELNNEDRNETHIVIPDLSVICDKNGFTETKYVGVPNLIIEIISPSNQSHDLVYKLNLYEKFGVNEYWIVNPIINHIQVFLLEEGKYIQKDAAKDTGTVKSSRFKKFKVDAGRLFSLIANLWDSFYHDCWREKGNSDNLPQIFPGKHKIKAWQCLITVRKKANLAKGGYSTFTRFACLFCRYFSWFRCVCCF